MRSTTLALIAVATIACKEDKKIDLPPAPGSGSSVGSGSSSGPVRDPLVGPNAGSGSGSGSGAARPTGTGRIPAKMVIGGFETPESVLYDADADVYLVSNIKGKPNDTDDNGYISRLAPDGSFVARKWIDGKSRKVDLDAPKGMAISGGILYVADITVVRKFDAKTGKPKGKVKVKGARFLNDVVADGKGNIYVSDTGVDKKLEPSGNDAIYRITKRGKAKKIFADKKAGGPNGLYYVDDKALWCVTFGSGEVFRIKTSGGARADVTKLPWGQLDGIARWDNKQVVISSWEGKAIYRGMLGGDDWQPIITDVDAPADIAVDPKRRRVLIPRFVNGELVIQPLDI
jgi:hypothetical protein